MYFVYVLQSQRDSKRYVGFTNNLGKRLLELNHRSKL
ncbi:MAG: GIY-YIG nuclease family protein [Candidatus Sungbacteria bacterium]|uniref:GIY-YIG nuclease family protein n=1 Tax=Candidatus Sungiibacteriota bacterium TaxID=2750080 RepID=A0A932YZ02_9BACT|nr:GIY-YIG nuclease family protein [Candidatus Sungbacteria bacterium]